MDKSSAFTPGPWRLAEDDETIVVTEALDKRGNCSVVADALTTIGKASAQDIANARLIAATPRVLEELQGFVSDLTSEGRNRHGCLTINHDALARRIARAQGVIASAIEARSGETGTGSTVGESAAPTGETHDA